MTPFLPNDFKVKVKQHLRDVRFVARGMRPPSPAIGASASRHAATGSGPPILEITRKISDFSDSALQTLETMAIGILSSDPQARFGAARAYPLDRYRRAGGARGAAMFARDGYFAAKQIMRSKSVANPLVSEALLAAAYRRAVRDGGDRGSAVDAGEGGRLGAISHDAAVLALAIIGAGAVQSPARFDASPGGDLWVDAGVYVASAIGLATAVAGYHRDLLAPDDPVYTGVCAAVDARYGLFEQAIGAPDAASALAHAFAELAPHLP